MKRLHKLALSVVAVVAVVISGCGADEKNMPEVIKVIPSSTFSDGDKVLIDFDEKHNEKNEIQSVVYLEGRRPCKILKQGDDGRYYKVELSGGCPPKGRLNTQSYKFKVQTKGGRYFCYEGNANINKATENTYPVGNFKGTFAETYIHRVSCDK